MTSRLEKLESEIAHAIARGEEMVYIRRNLVGYNTPEEFYELHAKLVARKDAREAIAAEHLP